MLSGSVENENGTIRDVYKRQIQMVYAVYPLTWALSSIAFFFYYRRANWMRQGEMERKEA